MSHRGYYLRISSKKLFYCFGCGASGNVINFVQKYNGISFGDAVDRLTDEYGIDRTTKLRSETVAFLKKKQLKTDLIYRKFIIKS